jgi:hypothetical protein
MNSLIKFSYNDYASLLKKILTKRSIVTFLDYKKKKTPFLILRHDIEYFTEAALNLGLVEFKLGVKSTFFFLLTSTYNIFSEKNIEIIKKLKEMGHQFGIHYDSHLLKENNVNFNKNLKLQINLFENFFKTKIKVISSHRPKLDYQNYKNKKILNVYNSFFQKKIKYFSDSQQVFRLNVDNILATNLNLHLLIHDYTWSNSNNKWEQNIVSFNKDEYIKSIKYYNAIIKDWQKGLLDRKKKDLIFKRNILKL